MAITSVTRGANFAYVTKAVPQLQNSTHSIIVLNDAEGSAFIAMFGFIGMIFAPLGGILAGKIGRRMTILLTSPFVAIGAIHKLR